METPSDMFAESRRLLDLGHTQKALAIWLRWLMLEQSTLTALHDLPCYFELLLQALRQCKHSNLQKYCLAILRASVSRLEHDHFSPSFCFLLEKKQDYVEAYERYCNLFETIVMGRYLNQVEECVTQFPSYVHDESTALKDHSAESAVHEDWWLLLYATALQSNNDQIRLAVGSWLLQNYQPGPTASEPSETHGTKMQPVEASFLDRILSWAMYGQLLTKTLERDGQEIQCSHGQTLAAFCSRLSLQPSYSEWTLEWLISHVSTLNQHATVYVVHGLQLGLQNTTIKAMRSLLALMSKITFAPFPTLVLRHDLRALMVKSKELPPNSGYEEAIKALELHLCQSVDGEAEPFCEPNDSHPGYLKVQNESEYRIYEHLKLRGYIHRSQSGAYTLHWPHIERYEPNQATWEYIAKCWSYWVSHMLRDSISHEQVRDFVSECVDRFFKLSRRKTRLWKTTAKSLRKLYLEVFPDILTHPAVQSAIIDFINDPPSPTPEYLLDAAVACYFNRISAELNGGDVFHVYADESVGHACIFDMLLNLRSEEKEWGRQLLDTLLTPWVNQKEPVPIVSKWKKTSQLQAMVILITVCLQSGPDEVYWSNFLILLGNEPNPHFRFLIEWILLQLYEQSLADTKLTQVENVLEILETSDPSNPNPKLIASLVKMAVQMIMTIRHWTSITTAATLLERLLGILTALIASPRIPIKFEAQASFPMLFSYAMTDESFYFLKDNRSFSLLNKFITGLDKFKNLPEIRVLTAFDMTRDKNLTTLFEGGYLYSSQPETPLLYVRDLEEIHASDSLELVSQQMELLIPLGELGPEVRSTIAGIKHRVNVSKSGILVPQSSQSTGPLQTKSFHLDLSALHLDDAAPSATHNTGPILVGSLLETPVNLGGLSRAANVFGCHSLHIPSLDLLKNPQFKTVSVDSELHLSITATPSSELLAYLQSAKREGWTVVGLEQTDSSVIIGMPNASDRKKLPRKAIIVMGAEKTGIPADVLLECDLCIEIKQWGVTRSLNVQTAAACILFEWRREWGDGSESAALQDTRK